MTTVVALFERPENAIGAMQALRARRRESTGSGARGARVPTIGHRAILGSVLGLVIGFALGALLAVSMPAMVASLGGGWVGLLILASGVAGGGGIVGLLLSAASSEMGDLYYEEEVEAGQTMVKVKVDEFQVESTRDLLLALGATEAAVLEKGKAGQAAASVVD